MIMSTEEMAAVLDRTKLWYLASVYTSHPDGLDAAALEIETLAAKILVDVGVPFFCPIAHWHRISIIAGISQTDHDLWMRLDSPFMERCDGIIIPLMENWNMSQGIRFETAYFREAGKPVVYWRF